MKTTERTHSAKLPVLLVTPQPFFERRGTPIAVRYVLEALSELGYEVDLIAFPIGEKLEIPGLRIHRLVNILGIRSVPIGVSLRKLFFDFFLYLKVRKFLKSNQYSYVHAVEEASIIVALAARGSNVPFIYDMASSLPEQLENHPLIGIKPFLKLVKLLESWVIQRANYIACSGGLLSHVLSVRKDAKASEWWFPSVAIDGVRPEAVKQYRKELQLDSQERLFVYTGSFSSYQGIGVLLEAISLVEKSGVSARFLLAGATSEELLDVQSQWKSDFPAKATVLGRVSRKEVGKMLMASDALISPRLFGRNIPLKIFDYMGAGKPIIASSIHAHRAVLDESRAVFFENTPESLANAVIELTRNPEKAASLSKSSLVYAKEFLTWPQFRMSVQSMADEVMNIPRAESSSESADLSRKIRK